MIDVELQNRLALAVEELTLRVQAAGIKVEDEDSDARVRQVLDGSDPPLDWAGPGITPDEWFFITTFYTEMTIKGQRTHIRKFFPLFVQEVGRDIRNFTTELLANWELRYPWMKTRLCRMAEVLRQSELTMEGYVVALREIESKATPDNLTPALDRIIRDHRAGRYKTLSVFIRDCVKGNCFPIDSRVEKQLAKYDLRVKERRLVRLCLSMGQNPRKVARIFYWEDGIQATPTPQNEVIDAVSFEKAVKRFGAKRVMEAVGPAKIIEEMGVDWLISKLPPAQLKKLKERLK